MNAADKIDMKLHTNWISPEIFERNVAISTSEKVDTVFINIVANCMLAPSRRHLAAAINRHTRIAAVHNTIPHCFFTTIAPQHAGVVDVVPSVEHVWVGFETWKGRHNAATVPRKRRLFIHIFFLGDLFLVPFFLSRILFLFGSFDLACTTERAYWSISSFYKLAARVLICGTWAFMKHVLYTTVLSFMTIVHCLEFRTAGKASAKFPHSVTLFQIFLFSKFQSRE